MLVPGRPIWAYGLPYWWKVDHWPAADRNPPSAKPYNTMLCILHSRRRTWALIDRSPLRNDWAVMVEVIV